MAKDYSSVGTITKKQKEAMSINFSLVDSYNSIFSFYKKTENLDIENPIIEIPLNLIEIFKSEISFHEKKDVEFEDDLKENIFLYLKNKYDISYYSTLKIFNKVLNFDIETCKKHAKTLKDEEYKIKAKIINSNLDNFLTILDNNYLSPNGYELKQGDRTYITQEGKIKGIVSQNNEGAYFLKSFQPDLSNLFSKDIVFPYDIIKNQNLDLNKYIALEKPKKLEQNLEDLVQITFEKDEIDTISQIENIENLNITDTLNNFMFEYNQVIEISKKFQLELSNKKEIEIYKQLNNDEFSLEDESILFSFQKELNNSSNKFETLKNIKEQINEKDFQMQKEKIENYFQLMVSFTIIETINNRIKATKLMNELINNSQEKPIVDIIQKNNGKNIDLNSFILNIELIDISNFYSENTKSKVEELKLLKKDLDVNKYSFFINKNDLQVITKNIYQNFNEFYEFSQKYKNDKNKLDFSSIKETQTIETTQPIIEYFELNKVNTSQMEVFQKKDSKTIPKELKTLEFIEENSRKNDSSEIYLEKNSYIAISRILLLLKTIKEEQKDLSMFSKYFSSKDNIQNTVSKLLKFIEQPNNDIKIDFPLNFNSLFYKMNDELRNIVKEYMIDNHIEFNENNRFLINLNDKYSELFNKTSNVGQDYIRLKNFYIQNYNFIDDNVKKYVEKNGFKQFFIDFNSMKLKPIFDEFKKSLPLDSFLLKQPTQKLIYIEDELNKHSNRILNDNKLKLELKIMQLIQTINVLINDKEKIKECLPFFKNEESFNKFIGKVSSILTNEKIYTVVKKGIDNFSESGLLFSKYSKISFLNDELKEVFSEFIIIEIEPTFEDFLSLDSIELKLIPQITKVDNKYKVKNFMHYFYNELSNESNVILKLRTRMAQLSFLVLKMSQDFINKQYFDDKYLPYFPNLDSLNQFKNLINNVILIKGKYNLDIAEDQYYLRKFLKDNHMAVDDMIDNFQGYVPSGELANFFINDMKSLVKNKEYYLDLVGITNRGKLSYEYSILTPEIIVQNDKYKGGLVVGYNLRVTNKPDMDKNKIKNLLISYFNGSQKPELKSYFNIFDFQQFQAQIEKMKLKDLKDIFEKINQELTKKNKQVLTFNETPKEPASKMNFDGEKDLEFKLQSKMLRNIPSMFASIIKLRDMDTTKPITIHINEGCKDAMSLSTILSYSKDKNQFAIPLQGTKGFKKEFENFLFNLDPNQEIIVKLWGDLDYAGLTLIEHLKEIIKNYKNVKLISMQELTFNSFFNKKLEENGFISIKGADLTDWSIAKAGEKMYKQNQISLIDNYKTEFSYTSDTFLTIALESLKLELKKWQEVGEIPTEILFKIEKYLDKINLKIDDFKDEVLLKEYIDIKRKEEPIIENPIILNGAK